MPIDVCYTTPSCGPTARITAGNAPAHVKVRVGVPGPPGPPGGRIIRYHFPNPSLVWSAAHGGIGEEGLCVVRDVSGRMMNAQVDFDATQFTVRLTSAAAGYVDVLVNHV